MTYFNERSESDLCRNYGYGNLNRLSFELAPAWHEILSNRQWKRLFEITLGSAADAAGCDIDG